jgi:phosphate transport system ATP-binding protein
MQVRVPAVPGLDGDQASIAAQSTQRTGAPKMETRALTVRYGTFVAVRDISVTFPENTITAIIGPSGSGKSTFLRSLNRMHDMTPGATVEGEVLVDGLAVYGSDADPVEVRRRTGMVFQRPNVFAKSIFDNVAYGLRYSGGKHRSKHEVAEEVERALRHAALWDEVKDRLGKSALGLSGGQQQRLCIARAIAVRPEVILMDEPCSALDPVATLRIEDLMRDLANDYTIVIVTHNMQQAARVSDTTVFMTMGSDRAGELIEVGPASEIFTRPRDERTEAYITGRVG